MHKSNDSSITTTGTPNSHLCADSLENSLKYMNPNFETNSNISSQNEDACQEYQKVQYYSPEKSSKPLPNKILPTMLHLNGSAKPKNEELIPLKEKSVYEMGYEPNAIEGWENIVQPPKEDLYKLLKHMIDNHIKPSVQICIGEVTFNCHMMVLQCYSEFFMECNNEILIQLPKEKITPAAFLMVYDWMLSPQPLVQREGILELFNAANFLRIKELINQCWVCLDDDICFGEDMAFLLYLEARNYGLENLEQLMLMRICKFFLTLVASKEFLTLNAKEICTLLSSNTIGVNSEIEIFMAVVRWLSHDWPERERYLLEVVKCVRFSLMPPWFLVTLNKNTDCMEIDRIIDVPEVKKMINDGITYTNILLYYGENRLQFLNLLERFQLLAPTQRQWVYDKECKYHHRFECPNMESVNYRAFLEYLEMIRTVGKDYWRSLEMDKASGKSLHCFLCTDCRKTNEPNLAADLSKHSRNQGIQCPGSLKNPKGKVSTLMHKNVSGKNFVRRSPRAHPKCVPTCAPQINESVNNNQTEKAEASIDFKYPPKSDIQINADVAETQQQQLAQTDVIEQRNFSKSHTFSNNQDKDEKPSQQQQQQQQEQQLQQQSLSKAVYENLQQEKHEENKSRVLLTDNCCTVIYKRAAAAAADAAVGSNLDVQDDVCCIEGQHQQLGQLCLISDNPDVVTDTPVTICHGNNKAHLQEFRARQEETFNDLTRISNHKVLVFGGIDPYSQHVQLLQPHQKSQKELKKQQQQQLHLHPQQELLQRRRVHSIDSLIMSASTHLHPLRSRSHQKETYACARTGTCATNAVANNNLDNFGDHVLCYDIEATEWRHLSHIPFGSRHHHAVVVCNGLIYVIGGTRTSKKSALFEKSVWCFNPSTVKWHLETSLPEARRDFAAIAVDSQSKPTENDRQLTVGFYVIGGESVNGKALQTVWFYNIKRKLWSKQPSLNMGRYGLAAAMVNKEIWVAGGIINDSKSHGETSNASTTAHAITDTIEIFNLNCTHCGKDDDVLLANNHIKGFLYGKLFEVEANVAGGDVADFKERQNLKRPPVAAAGNANCTKCQWIKSKHNLRIPRLFGRFSRLSNGQLYLVGGLSFNNHLKRMTSLAEIDVFDVNQQNWEHIGDLNLARHGHDVVPLNDHCFVVVGGVSTFEHCAFSKVEVFCTKTRKSLKDLPALPWPVSGCAAVAMN